MEDGIRDRIKDGIKDEAVSGLDHSAKGLGRVVRLIYLSGRNHFKG